MTGFEERDDPLVSSIDADVSRDVLTAAKGTAFVAGGQFFEYGARFFIALLLARLLGANDYGLYVLAISAATGFAALASMGLDGAMVRYVAIMSRRGDRGGLRGTIELGLGLSTVTSVIAGVILYFVAGPLATGLFDEPRLEELIKILALIVPLLTLSNVLLGIALGLKRMGYAALAENVVPSLVRLGLLGLVALVTSGLSVTAALVVFALSDVAASATMTALLRRKLPIVSHRPSEPVHHDVRDIFAFSLPLWMTGFLRYMRRNFETFVLGVAQTAASVGVFAIVKKVNMISHTWLLSLIVAVKPTLAELQDQVDKRNLAHMYRTATRWALTLTLPFFLIGVLYRDALLNLFGESFLSGATALVILLVADLVDAGTGICGPMIEMTGHTAYKLLNSLALTVTLVVSSAMLIPRWGVVGGALAAFISIVSVNILTVFEVWYLERIWPYDKTFWKPLTAALIALVPGIALGALFPVGTNLVRAMFQGATLAATYAGALLVFGLTSDDRLIIDRIRARVVGRPAPQETTIGHHGGAPAGLPRP